MVCQNDEATTLTSLNFKIIFSITLLLVFVIDIITSTCPIFLSYSIYYTSCNNIYYTLYIICNIKIFLSNSHYIDV